MKQVASAILLIGLSMSAVCGEETGPLFKLDQSSRQVVSITNLYRDETCHRDSLTGKSVKREFAADALRLTGFVIEKRDGSREHINISIDVDRMNMNQRGWVLAGLQSLLREGRSISAVIVRCGASGHVSMLDEIR
jgi:hypothetical protein